MLGECKVYWRYCARQWGNGARGRAAMGPNRRQRGPYTGMTNFPPWSHPTRDLPATRAAYTQIDTAPMLRHTQLANGSAPCQARRPLARQTKKNPAQWPGKINARWRKRAQFRLRQCFLRGPSRPDHRQGLPRRPVGLAPMP